MTEEKKKSSIAPAVIVAVILALVAAAFGVFYIIFGPQGVQGAKTIIVEVVDKEGIVSAYEHHTDAEFLRAAIEEMDSVTLEGDESQYGLYIKKVNGISAVYETDGAYWAIYVNGEYAMNGVDTEPVKDGSTYSFKYESAQTVNE